MGKFYIDLKVVEPYINYLGNYKNNVQQFIVSANNKFQSIKDIFDDKNVEKFLEITNFINTGMTKVIESVEECATVMKKEAIAYRKYLGM